jgi:heat shock protein HslJ
MKQVRIFSLGILILLFIGCSGSSKLANPNLLIGKTWVLSSFKGDYDLSMFSLGTPLISFLEEERLGGFAGCNNFSGTFSLEGSGLQLDPGAITKKACSGTAETAFISAMGNVKNFSVEKSKLILMDGTIELMSFFPKKD